MTAPLLRLIARALVASLLLAQAAVAGHACAVVPGTSALHRAMAVSTPDSNAAQRETQDDVNAMHGDCAGMADRSDADTLALCIEHCRQGQQHDHAWTLALPITTLSLRYLISPLPAQAPQPLPDDRLNALVAASPPLAILHCVRRT